MASEYIFCMEKLDKTNIICICVCIFPSMHFQADLLHSSICPATQYWGGGSVVMGELQSQGHCAKNKDKQTNKQTWSAEFIVLSVFLAVVPAYWARHSNCYGYIFHKIQVIIWLDPSLQFKIWCEQHLNVSYKYILLSLPNMNLS